MDIFRTQMKPGTVALAWVNSYSAVVVRTPNVAFLFDPVAMPVEPDMKADVIAISHDHSDHWEPELVIRLQEHTGALVATSSFLAAQLNTLPSDRIVGMEVGGCLEAGGAQLIAQRCDHSARQPLSFLLRSEEGITLYHPSDSTPFPEMEEVRKKYGPRILLYMGTSFEPGARIAQMVQPEALVSYRIGAPGCGRTRQTNPHQPHSRGQVRGPEAARGFRVPIVGPHPGMRPPLSLRERGLG